MCHSSLCQLTQGQVTLYMYVHLLCLLFFFCTLRLLYCCTCRLMRLSSRHVLPGQIPSSNHINMENYVHVHCTEVTNSKSRKGKRASPDEHHKHRHWQYLHKQNCIIYSRMGHMFPNSFFLKSEVSGLPNFWLAKVYLFINQRLVKVYQPETDMGNVI